MTVPTKAAVPAYDMSGFERALDGLRKEFIGAEIHTRSEVRLVDAERELKELDAQGRDVRAKLDYLDTAQRSIDEIRKIMTTHDADIAVERNALLQLINALRGAGVTTEQGKESGNGSTQ